MVYKNNKWEYIYNGYERYEYVAADVKLEIDKKNNLLYMLIDSESMPYVLRYNGRKWEELTQEGYVYGINDMADSVNIKIDKEGVVYLLYIANGLNGKPVILRYKKDRWKPVGKVGFTKEGVSVIKLDIDRENKILYIAYKRPKYKISKGRKVHDIYDIEDVITVMKYRLGGE